MDEISSSVVLPITDAQMRAFSTWVLNTYETYARFMDAIKSPEVDRYIKSHILPLEMLDMLSMSGPYIGEKYGDNNIRLLQLYRRRIFAKMKNLKGKVASMTFPSEAAQTRRDNRVAAVARRQYNEARQIRLDRETLEYRDYMIATDAHELRLAMSAKIYPYPPTVKIQLSEEDAETLVMDDDCVICFSQHKMVDACTINCGHQFGRLCLAKWKKHTCPLCRTQIVKTTVFIETIVKNEAIEQEILASLAV